MNREVVERNNALRPEERMPLAGQIDEAHVQCDNCLLVVTKAELAARGYACPGCGERVCVVCGCTDSNACADGCAWSEPGVCSTHEGRAG
jgi:hypothetical protein